MSTVYDDVDSITDRLVELVREIERFGRHGLWLPPALVEAAQRIVELGNAYREDNALDRLPLARAVVYLMRREEEVRATDLQFRLLEAVGKNVPITTINVALHRARAREEIVLVERGVYRLPTQEELIKTQRKKEGK